MLDLILIWGVQNKLSQLSCHHRPIAPLALSASFVSQESAYSFVFNEHCMHYFALSICTAICPSTAFIRRGKVVTKTPAAPSQLCTYAVCGSGGARERRGWRRWQPSCATRHSESARGRRLPISRITCCHRRVLRAGTPTPNFAANHVVRGEIGAPHRRGHAACEAEAQPAADILHRTTPGRATWSHTRLRGHSTLQGSRPLLSHTHCMYVVYRLCTAKHYLVRNMTR